MEIKGANYNFGRVIYLTIGKISGDPYLFNGQINQMTNKVTIAFDPKTDPQLSTRIDFLIRHQYGQVSNVTGAAYSMAAIDLYNIGAALREFMNAYNETENNGQWKSTNISKYVCVLQAGYYGGKITTIFVGAINSYNIERKQTETNVDTVWHLYCAGSGGYDIVPLSQSEIAVSGTDYLPELQKQNQLLKSYTSGEEYLKAIVMAHPREVYITEPNDTFIIGDSFSIQKKEKSASLVPMPQIIEITNENFDQFFEIKYRKFNSGKEDSWLKSVWQTEAMIASTTAEPHELQLAISDIARRRNCGADIRFDASTGKQIIFIYREGTKSSQKKSDWIITDFQNLRKPPLVSGKSIRFDLLLEPAVRPDDTFELRITEDFDKLHGKQNASFGVSFGNEAGQWATVFAGSNFEGLSNLLTNRTTKQTIKKTGNVFNKKYVALYVIHQGSTHDKEWSTTVDCAAVAD